MFACLYSDSPSLSSRLLEIGREFSPLVELTSTKSVIVDISGLSFLFGTPQEIAYLISQRTKSIEGPINVAIAPNPDVAAIISSNVEGVSVINEGEEAEALAPLAILSLLKEPIVIGKFAPQRHEEIFETFELWGIKTLGDLAALPADGVIETLGNEGLTLQQLARGARQRVLKYLEPTPLFSESLDLESPIELLEQLSFVVSGIIGRLCARMGNLGLATNEIMFKAKIGSDGVYERGLRLAFPMTASNWLSRLLMVEIESHPPIGPLQTVSITASPTKPRQTQQGLFDEFAPEPEKMELTIARLVRLMGNQNVGSIEVIDDHEPDSFRLKAFSPEKKRKHRSISEGETGRAFAALRVARPPLPAELQVRSGHFIRLKCKNSFPPIAEKVVMESGPWLASGKWWSLQEKWVREEWDLALNDGTICRVFRNLIDGQWYLAGTYD